MVLVGVCLVVERGLNVMVPHQLGVITDELSKGNELIIYTLYEYDAD